MNDNEALRKDILVRLRKIEGQVKGIQGMVEKDVCCRDVLTQISAIRAAINKVGVLLIENYARNCMGIGEEDKEELAGLEQLIKTKILTRYYFHSEDGKGIYRIYCLEKMGKYLLNSRGVECKWQPTDNTKPVAMIKKRLASNQLLISYKEKVQAFDSFQIKVPMNAKILGKQFKATGGKVTLSKNGKSIDFIFEVIRREDDWQKKLADKMKLYKDFYENFVAMDSGFKTIPQLILLCEDEKHMAETFREIVVNGLGIDKLNLYYTTDLRQNDSTLEHSLAEFKLDPVTNKYKMENVDIKLLG